MAILPSISPHPMAPVLTQPAMPLAGGEAPLDITKLKLQLDSDPAAPNFEGLTWGKRFTPHMLCVKWTAGQGWAAPVIQPYGPLSISPAAPVLQYASSCFEGMKAYRCNDGHVRLFRPEMNMARMNRSAARASLPTFDSEAMIALIKRLIQVDVAHVPHLLGESLYLRPTLIGTPDTLGMGTPGEALLYCICNPVGSYFGVGAAIDPVSLLAISKSVRAWPGGTGSYKLGGNYVCATLLASQAQLQGHQQVLWLYGTEEPELTEVGAMNLFVVFRQGAKCEWRARESAGRPTSAYPFPPRKSLSAHLRSSTAPSFPASRATLFSHFSGGTRRARLRCRACLSQAILTSTSDASLCVRLSRLPSVASLSKYLEAEQRHASVVSARGTCWCAAIFQHIHLPRSRALHHDRGEQNRGAVPPRRLWRLCQGALPPDHIAPDSPHCRRRVDGDVCIETRTMCTTTRNTSRQPLSVHSRGGQRRNLSLEVRGARQFCGRASCVSLFAWPWQQ